MNKRQIIEPKVVLIPKGCFTMGSNEGQDNEKPIHSVWIDSFEMAKWPVTNREYVVFLEETGHESPKYWYDEQFNDPDRPVVAVSWYDALEYCKWMSKETGKEYRLPSEAEREKAARGGLEGRKYPWGDQFPDGENHYELGWAADRPERVGKFEPNGHGLHNMADNVHEWCSDWFDYDYYNHSGEKNPTGPTSGTRRVARGGSWRHKIKITRCAARSSLPPENKFSDFGFRCVRSI